MKIFCTDIDNCIADVRHWQIACGTIYEYENFGTITNINMSVYHTSATFNWNKEVRKNFNYKEIFGKCLPIPFTSEYMKKIKELGYEIHIVTARNKDSDGIEVYEKTAKWLNKHDIYFDKLTTDIGSRLGYCKENIPTVFLDDEPKNVNEIADNFPNTKVFCFNQQHNINVEEKGNLKRVHSWPELYYRILDISKED